MKNIVLYLLFNYLSIYWFIYLIFNKLIPFFLNNNNSLKIKTKHFITQLLFFFLMFLSPLPRFSLSRTFSPSSPSLVGLPLSGHFTSRQRHHRGAQSTGSLTWPVGSVESCRNRAKRELKARDPAAVELFSGRAAPASVLPSSAQLVDVLLCPDLLLLPLVPAPVKLSQKLNCFFFVRRRPSTAELPVTRGVLLGLWRSWLQL